MTAAQAGALADRVRSEYLTKKRETDPVAEALDILQRILIWAETPLSPTTDLGGVSALDAIAHSKGRVRQIAGEEIP